MLIPIKTLKVFIWFLSQLMTILVFKIENLKTHNHVQNDKKIDLNKKQRCHAYVKAVVFCNLENNRVANVENT